MFDNNETLCLGSVFSHKMSGFFISIGARRPAYAGSMGKVLLSGLSEQKLDAYLASVPRAAHTAQTLTTPAALRREISQIRTSGYAINRGELTAGIVGIAVPVRNKHGVTAAVVNVNWISVHPVKNAEIKRCLGPCARRQSRSRCGWRQARCRRVGFPATPLDRGTTRVSQSFSMLRQKNSCAITEHLDGRP